MARKSSPYHSKEGSVYHVYSDCASGGAIARRLRKPGSGGRKLCAACKDIKAGKRMR
jgi:hypothetical protein